MGVCNWGLNENWQGLALTSPNHDCLSLLPDPVNITNPTPNKSIVAGSGTGGALLMSLYPVRHV